MPVKRVDAMVGFNTNAADEHRNDDGSFDDTVVVDTEAEDMDAFLASATPYFIGYFGSTHGLVARDPAEKTLTFKRLAESDSGKDNEELLDGGHETAWVLPFAGRTQSEITTDPKIAEKWCETYGIFKIDPNKIESHDKVVSEVIELD